MANERWSKEFPTEVGWYWCYGNFVGNKSEEEFNKGLRLVPIEVRKIANGVVHVGMNTFIHKEEWKGYWIKAEVPEPPVVG